MQYTIIATEGSHDQAAIGKILQLLGLQRFSGKRDLLDPFWAKFIPTYPKKGNLYTRLDMPSIYNSATHSVAIYQGGGDELLKNLQAEVMSHDPYRTEIAALGLVVDTDNNPPKQVIKKYADNLREFFPDFPNQPNTISQASPRTGIFLLPDGINAGVLDTVLVKCAYTMYPDHIIEAERYINSIDAKHKTHWKPFDHEKALVATIVSVLRPGLTNTASISSDEWICATSSVQVDELSACIRFIRSLLEL